PPEFSTLSLHDALPISPVREALLRLSQARDPECEYVFATRGGYPIDAHNFANRVWYPLLRYLDIEKRRPYQTRHTTATLMLASRSEEHTSELQSRENLV